ncbi:hypothetical protein ACNOYE_07345 [Nannocystaceae bacterium ST9]
MSSPKSGDSGGSNLAAEILFLLSPKGRERTAFQLYEESHAEDPKSLLGCLSHLVEAGFVSSVLRVYNDQGFGLYDFDDFNDVPDEIEDETLDPPKILKIDPENNIKVVYRIAEER